MTIVLDARPASDRFPGIGRYVVRLSEALVRTAGDDRIVLLHGSRREGARLVLPDLPGIECRASAFSLRQQWQVRRRLGRVRAEVYHSPYYLMPYWPGVPTVVTCYDAIPLVDPRGFGRGARLLYRVAHRLAFRAAAAILVPSEATMIDFMRLFGLDRRRLVVTPLAGDPPGTVPLDEIRAVRARHGLPERYVLHIGINKPHKNLAALVRGWAEVVRRHDGAGEAPPLVLAGPRDTRYSEPAASIERLGVGASVRDLGPVDEADRIALCAGATLFVFPSLCEGFGLPVLEAMGHGTPVACSGIPALEEVAGEAAAFFDPYEASSIAATVCRLLADADERQRLAEAGVARASEFSWDRTAAATRQVYRRVRGRT